MRTYLPVSAARSVPALRLVTVDSVLIVVAGDSNENAEVRRVMRLLGSKVHK